MRKFVSIVVLMLAIARCGLPKFHVQKSALLDLKKEESTLYSFSVVIYALKKNSTSISMILC